MSAYILTADEADGVRCITIDRADKRNALTRAMMKDLGDAVVAADADPDIRVIRLQSTGDVFCAGADLDGLAGDPIAEGADPGHGFLLSLAGAKKPLVVSVQGPAVGVGATMLIHFDFLYAAPQASLRMPFVDLGLTPEAGATFLLPAMIGRTQAARMLLLCEAIPAQDALAAGLVTEIVERDGLAERARDVARRLAAKPPQALTITKGLMRRANLIADMDTEQEIFRERQRSEESRAAVEAMRRRIVARASGGPSRQS